MRKVAGIACIAAGLVCLLISVGFVIYNKYEEKSGEKNSQILLQDIQENMQANEQDVRQPEPVLPEETTEETLPEETQALEEPQMKKVPAGGYESIGILSIPVLELELPVLADWSYEKLKHAPCHYYGSCYGSNFVIAAHNYASHFGRLSQLRQGDLILFTDAVGEVYCYEVILLETLPPTATEEMISSGFDLSLYTCTPGGGSRVTVRCNAVI